MNPIENHPRKNAAKAFTLIELLVVMSIIVVLMALLAPSFVNISSANNVSKSVYDIAGILDQARTYAMGNNTYVYVGIAEVDSAYKPSATTKFATGTGMIVMAVVASKDGTRGYDATNSNLPSPSAWTNYNNGASLVAISRLQSFSNAHLAANFSDIPNSGGSARQTVGGAGTYIIGNTSCSSVTPFDWPLGSAIGSGQYSFTKVINFDPQGVARIQYAGNQDTIAQYMEIGLQPAHGSTFTPTPAAPLPPGNVAAIQVDGMTGSNRVYRP
jgi:prepilin-type N-terminal cleavage/methylation domain-containing protein